MAVSNPISSINKFQTTIDISICIVTHNCSQILTRCLKSLSVTSGTNNLEIIVVDNHSIDNTKYMIQKDFHNVHLIYNKNNLGFAVAINQAIDVAVGRYIVILNPDTIVNLDSLSILAEFMDRHPNTGMCGPKVINEDGTFQKSCRRGESRPLAVMSYIFGLDKLFPMNTSFNRYHLNYIDENMQTKVRGLSGSCMMIRYSTLNIIGNFDEQFFLYQEDSDICLRALNNGWDINYIPKAEIIHTGGAGGTDSHFIFLLYQWHLSYFKLYRKHYSKDYNILFNIFFYLIMCMKLILTFATIPFRK